MQAIDLKFTSGNGVPVESARITAEEWSAVKATLAEANGWLKHFQRSVPEQHAELVKKLESTRTALRRLIDEVRIEFRNGRIPGDIEYWLGKGEEALSGKSDAKPVNVKG